MKDVLGEKSLEEEANESPWDRGTLKELFIVVKVGKDHQKLCDQDLDIFFEFKDEWNWEKTTKKIELLKGPLRKVNGKKSF